MGFLLHLFQNWEVFSDGGGGDESDEEEDTVED